MIAGTLWPETIQDISMNTPLVRDIAERVGAGLPTIAMGGGMLIMLAELQDTLGRTSEFAGVIPARGEILWDLEYPAYVEVRAARDNVLLGKGDRLTGWVLSELELNRVRSELGGAVDVAGRDGGPGAAGLVRRGVASLLSGTDTSGCTPSRRSALRQALPRLRRSRAAHPLRAPRRGSSTIGTCRKQ